ncbi:hypothetical protein D3C76_1589560 [compost metagenome]
MPKATTIAISFIFAYFPDDGCPPRSEHPVELQIGSMTQFIIAVEPGLSLLLAIGDCGDPLELLSPAHPHIR